MHEHGKTPLHQPPSNWARFGREVLSLLWHMKTYIHVFFLTAVEDVRPASTVPRDGQLGCFSFFAITNNTGVNLLVYILLQRLTFLWMRLSHWRNRWANGLKGFGFVAAQRHSKKCCDEVADVSE